jgi:SAM-dependent methyltransferase
MFAAALAGHGYRAVGFDLSADAAAFWPRRGVARACRATATAIPFAGASFDAVCAVDLLESEAVDEQEAARELVRVLRPGGVLILVVPAYRWLMSPAHHRAVRASRRYTRGRIRAVLGPAGATVIRASHLFLTMFPAVALYRLWRWLTDARSGPAPSEVAPQPSWLNAILFRLTDWERALLTTVDLPFGSSILVVLRRPAA